MRRTPDDDLQILLRSIDVRAITELMRPVGQSRFHGDDLLTMAATAEAVQPIQVATVLSSTLSPLGRRMDSEPLSGRLDRCSN